MKRIAVCPGSFDPITKGHLDIITRASTLFDEIIVLVSVNHSKKCSFNLEERVELVNDCIEGLENVRVDSFSGLLANYLEESGAIAIVKGLRAVSDFEYEFQQALGNKKLNPNAETVFLTTNSDYMFLSSSLVRQIAYFGGSVSDFVPAQILDKVNNRLSQKNDD